LALRLAIRGQIRNRFKGRVVIQQYAETDMIGFVRIRMIRVATEELPVSVVT